MSGPPGSGGGYPAQSQMGGGAAGQGQQIPNSPHQQQQMMYQQQQQQQQMMRAQQGMHNQQVGYPAQVSMQSQMHYQQQQQHQQQSMQMQPQMMGQPGPQMQMVQQQHSQQAQQPRSPMVMQQQQQPHSVAGMGMSPMVGGPHSTGPLSMHNMGPASQGPLSVQQQPQGGPGSIGPAQHSGGPMSVQQPSSSLHQMGGPPSVPHPHQQQHSVSGGPLSTGGPLSQQPQQQHSVSGAPPSMGPLSVPPQTPINPASQMQAGATPGTPKQPGPSSEGGQNFVNDPVTLVKSLILKDLRHSIVKLNKCAGVALRDRKNPAAPDSKNSEDYISAMNNFLAICDDIDCNLTMMLETQKQMGKLEKVFDKTADKQQSTEVGQQHVTAVNNYIDQTKHTQSLFEKSIAHINRTREKIKKREQMSVQASAEAPMEE